MGGFAEEYAQYAFGPQRGSLPGGLVTAWLTLWVGALWVGLVFSLLLLLFPTGRLPSPRWRLVAWACVASVAAGCAVLAVTPGPMAQVPGQPNNPLGIENAAAALDRIEAPLNICLALLVLLLCAASVVVRFRRAGGVERQQLKWFAYGAGQLALLLGSGLGLGGLWKRVPQGLSDLLFAISFAMIPVAIGIVILRHRLYDIDRLIRRTLVYGLLSALLAAVYAGLVLGSGQLFDWWWSTTTAPRPSAARPASSAWAWSRPTGAAAPRLGNALVAVDAAAGPGRRQPCSWAGWAPSTWPARTPGPRQAYRCSSNGTLEPVPV